MPELRYTFVTDGSSDRALIPVLTWLLRANHVQVAIQSQWADLGSFIRTRKLSLADKVALAIEFYPCDLLFVHRDAESETRTTRMAEIQAALEQTRSLRIPAICVIPVRMQEAWLLFDEQAIRAAASNQNGQDPLHLPPLHQLENVPDPKKMLYGWLRVASGRRGRRLDQFSVTHAAQRVADFIDDFTPLRALPAFLALEADIQHIVATHGWAGAD